MKPILPWGAPRQVAVALVVTLCIAVLAAGWFQAPAWAQDAVPGAPAGPDSFGSEQLFLPLVAAPGPQAGAVIPSQYVVLLKPPAERTTTADGQPVSPAAFAQEVVAAAGGTLLYTYSSAVEGFAAQLPAAAAASLALDANVALVEPDRVVTIDDDLAPAATQSSATWGLDRIDQRNRPLNTTYIYNTKGAGVHVYVIDTGMRTTHVEFAGRVGAGYTAVNDGRGVTDCSGHGTHVSGTIGGTTWGVAKGVILHPVRVLDCNGSGSTASVIAGVDWVSANAIDPAVANMSLGGSLFSALDTAVTNAINTGITFVVAAGNSGANACNYSPARTAAAITVGSTTSSDVRSSFSNYGACLDLFAPGSSITSAYYSSDTASGIMSGTSMASPHVAGAAALYLGLYPAAAPATVRNALVNNASAGLISNPGASSPNLLLFTGFIGSSTPPPPAGTPTPLPTTPPPTPTPTPVPPTPTPQPIACTQRLGNPGFEQGSAVWTQSSSNALPLICSTGSCGESNAEPQEGEWNAWLGGVDRETAELRQTITLPADPSAGLSFWYWIDATDYCGYDFAYVNLIYGSTTTQLKRYSLCTTNNTNGWRKETFNLSAYAGRTITLAFRVTTDSSYVGSFFVDNTALQTGSACVTTGGPVITPDDPIDVGPSSAAKPSTVPEQTVR